MLNTIFHFSKGRLFREVGGGVDRKGGLRELLWYAQVDIHLEVTSFRVVLLTKEHIIFNSILIQNAVHGRLRQVLSGIFYSVAIVESVSRVVTYLRGCLGSSIAVIISLTQLSN